VILAIGSSDRVVAGSSDIATTQPPTRRRQADAHHRPDPDVPGHPLGNEVVELLVDRPDVGEHPGDGSRS